MKENQNEITEKAEIWERKGDKEGKKRCKR
jgi:hypothetical protein